MHPIFMTLIFFLHKYCMPLIRGESTISAVLDTKNSVRLASTANINIYESFSSFDSVLLQNNDRVILVGQNAPYQNGIFIWNNITGKLKRVYDADSSTEVSTGMSAYVEEGTHQGYTWTLVTPNPIVLNSTPLIFSGKSVVSQTLSLTDATLTISGGNSVDLGPLSGPGPQGPLGAQGPVGPQGPQGIQGEQGIGIAQTLTLSGTYLSISDGNQIDLSNIDINGGQF